MAIHAVTTHKPPIQAGIFSEIFFRAGLHVSSMRHILQDAAKHLKHQLLLLLLKFTLLLELLKFEAFPLEEKLRARMAGHGRATGRLALASHWGISGRRRSPAARERVRGGREIYDRPWAVGEACGLLAAPVYRRTIAARSHDPISGLVPMGTI